MLLSLVPSLVPSERRVAQACIEDPGSIAEMSVAQVASLVGVSPATVVRACKHMGFSGFQQLRELLIRDLGTAAAPAMGGMPQAASMSSQPGGPGNVPAAIAARGDVHLVSAVFGHAAQAIAGALGALDLAEFDAAAAALRGCNRLLIVGNGTSLAAAHAAALHFVAGGHVVEYPADVVTQIISARTLGEGDVCLAVSDSGMNSFTLRSARLAVEAGATVIGITSYGKSDLAELATHALVAGADFHAWNDATVSGNVVQMLLLSALHLAAANADPEAVQARAAIYDEVLAMVAPEG